MHLLSRIDSTVLILKLYWDPYGSESSVMSQKCDNYDIGNSNTDQSSSNSDHRQIGSITPKGDDRTVRGSAISAIPPFPTGPLC